MTFHVNFLQADSSRELSVLNFSEKKKKEKKKDQTVICYKFYFAWLFKGQNASCSRWHSKLQQEQMAFWNIFCPIFSKKIRLNSFGELSGWQMIHLKYKPGFLRDFFLFLNKWFFFFFFFFVKKIRLDNSFWSSATKQTVWLKCWALFSVKKEALS